MYYHGDCQIFNCAILHNVHCIPAVLSRMSHLYFSEGWDHCQLRHCQQWSYSVKLCDAYESLKFVIWFLHCTMCTLFHTYSAGLSKLGHIIKNPKKYFYEYIFFPALTTRRKMEKSYFLWFSNSKFAIFLQFRVIFADFECSKNNVSSAGK